LPSSRSNDNVLNQHIGLAIGAFSLICPACIPALNATLLSILTLLGVQHMGIMVVDDEEGIRQLLTMFLAHNGYTAVSFSNGAKALAHLQESSELPELILLDMMMPVMDGAAFRHAQMQDPTSCRPLPSYLSRYASCRPLVQSPSRLTFSPSWGLSHSIACTTRSGRIDKWVTR
jgi:CheY-like chemotaxis protein